MNINGMNIDYEPGDSYATTQMLSDDEAAKSRADMRQEAINQFKDGARLVTENRIEQAVTALLGLVIQLRALNGKGERALADKLREAADFLEDL